MSQRRILGALVAVGLVVLLGYVFLARRPREMHLEITGSPLE